MSERPPNYPEPAPAERATVLRCANCGAVNVDPGGEASAWACYSCGQPTLVRALAEEPRAHASGSIAGVIVGGSLGAVAFGPIGMLVGAGAGALLGAFGSVERRPLIPR